MNGRIALLVLAAALSAACGSSTDTTSSSSSTTTQTADVNRYGVLYVDFGTCTSTTSLILKLDGDYLGTARSVGSARFLVLPGTHKLAIVNGETAALTFTQSFTIAKGERLVLPVC